MEQKRSTNIDDAGRGGRGGRTRVIPPPFSAMTKNKFYWPPTLRQGDKTAFGNLSTSLRLSQRRKERLVTSEVPDDNKGDKKVQPTFKSGNFAIVNVMMLRGLIAVNRAFLLLNLRSICCAISTFARLKT